jgi:hypothetical protein
MATNNDAEIFASTSKINFAATTERFVNKIKVAVNGVEQVDYVITNKLISVVLWVRSVKRTNCVVGSGVACTAIIVGRDYIASSIFILALI